MTNWNTFAQQLRDGYDAEGISTLIEGFEDQSGVKVPPHCVGLTTGGRDFQVVLMDVQEAVIYWMEFSDKIVKACSPRPVNYYEQVPAADNRLVDEHDAESLSPDGDELEEEENYYEDDDNISQPSKIDGLDIFSIYPYWTPRDFLAMLKNHSMALNFISRKSMEVIDVLNAHKPGEIRELLEPVFLKHGWPNVEQYEKEKCMEEVARAVRGRDLC